MAIQGTPPNDDDAVCTDDPVLDGCSRAKGADNGMHSEPILSNYHSCQCLGFIERVDLTTPVSHQ